MSELAVRAVSMLAWALPIGSILSFAIIAAVDRKVTKGAALGVLAANGIAVAIFGLIILLSGINA